MQVATEGPYDSEDPAVGRLGRTAGRVDFGSLRIPIPARAQLQVEKGTGELLRAVHVLVPSGRVSLSALAAPRSNPLWRGLSGEIADSLSGDGARVRTQWGEWGREVEAASNGALSRFVGVDGPRWMLYGVATGPADGADELADVLREMMRKTVVFRGQDPLPVKTVLPLRLPEHLEENVERARDVSAQRPARADTPGLDRSRGEAAARVGKPSAADAPRAIGAPGGGQVPLKTPRRPSDPPVHRGGRPAAEQQQPARGRRPGTAPQPAVPPHMTPPPYGATPAHMTPPPYGPATAYEPPPPYGATPAHMTPPPYGPTPAYDTPPPYGATPAHMTPPPYRTPPPGDGTRPGDQRRPGRAIGRPGSPVPPPVPPREGAVPAAAQLPPSGPAIGPLGGTARPGAGRPADGRPGNGRPPAPPPGSGYRDGYSDSGSFHNDSFSSGSSSSGYFDDGSFTNDGFSTNDGSFTNNGSFTNDGAAPRRSDSAALPADMPLSGHTDPGGLVGQPASGLTGGYESPGSAPGYGSLPPISGLTDTGGFPRSPGVESTWSLATPVVNSAQVSQQPAWALLGDAPSFWPDERYRPDRPEDGPVEMSSVESSLPLERVSQDPDPGSWSSPQEDLLSSTDSLHAVLTHDAAVTRDRQARADRLGRHRSHDG